MCYARAMRMPASTVAGYVPIATLRQIAPGLASEVVPWRVQTRAAALHADVSGSTALAERLATSGAEGAEELSRLLNAYFSPLVDAVADHGGDVVKFGGDGFLALWSIRKAMTAGPPASQPHAARSQCAT
jgi:class 3 adenylate cyclase